MNHHSKNCAAGQHGGDVPIDTLALDAFDLAFLAAARFFCLSFSGLDRAAWVKAILGAENFFPGPASAETMRRALGVVQDMRLARKSSLRFSNPRCRCCAEMVTQDERYLVQLVQALRAGRTSQAASSAMLLCEGNDVTRVMAAAQALADAAPAALQVQS